MGRWGGEVTGINFANIFYYVKASAGKETSWDEVPEDIKYTFDRLGIPEAEQKFLAGTGAQFESEVVYHSIRDRKSTRLNSSHQIISYAVFCLKKKKTRVGYTRRRHTPRVVRSPRLPLIHCPF